MDSISLVCCRWAATVLIQPGLMDAAAIRLLQHVLFPSLSYPLVHFFPLAERAETQSFFIHFFPLAENAETQSLFYFFDPFLLVALFYPLRLCGLCEKTFPSYLSRRALRRRDYSCFFLSQSTQRRRDCLVSVFQSVYNPGESVFH